MGIRTIMSRLITFTLLVSLYVISVSGRCELKTCQDHAKATGLGLKLPAGKYWVNPSGAVKPFQVSCVVKDGKVYTVFGHDSEAKMKAPKKEEARQSIRKVKYNLSMKQIRAVVAAASSCRQFIKFNCYHVTNNWTTKGGKKLYYWDGSLGTTNNISIGVVLIRMVIAPVE